MREKIAAGKKLNSTDYLRRVACWLTLAAVATAGFDELLVAEIRGFTVRFSLFFIAAACVCLLIIWIKEKGVSLPFGWAEIAILLFINLILCFFSTSGSILMKLGYELWFILDAALVVLSVNLFRTAEQKNFFLRFVIVVYAGMAVVCLLQMVSGLVGFPFYQEQWFGKLPRGDAFLSEPSYFACFILPAWVFLSYKNERKLTDVFPAKVNWVLFGIVTASLIVSTSRMGTLMMGLWLIFRLLVLPFSQDVPKKECAKRIITMGVVVILGFALLWVLYNAVNGMENNIPNGAINNDHSAVQEIPSLSERMTDFSGSDVPRLEGMKETLRTFTEKHIFVGSSLGGVFSAVMENSTTARQVVNLIAELLVAFGLPGIVVLGYYMYRLINASWKKSEQASITQALCWGLIWQLGILQFNNNGLRIYLWVNIAVISLYLPQTVIGKKACKE